jgi:hypothetical protein
MAEETFILMRTNMMEVVRKTGLRYEDLEKMYLEAKQRNQIVVLKVDEMGRVIFNE